MTPKQSGRKTILVTGGAGYVGTEVISLLLDKTDSFIVAIDNFSKGRIENIAALHNAPQRLVIEHVDIRDEALLDEIIGRYRPEEVLHLAAIVDAFSTNRKGKDEECMEVNYRAAVSFATLCKKHSVKKFVFQSTVSLYSRGEEITEEGEQKPLSTYGISKALAEKEILALGDESFLVTALRPATIAGFNVGFRYETIFNQACIKAIYDVPLHFFESAMEGKKTYLSVSDNARALLFALDHMAVMRGGVFNVTSFHTTLSEIGKYIKKHHGDFSYKIISERQINQQVYTINSDKIKSLGFMPKSTVEEVVQDTLTQLKKEKEFLATA